MISKSSKYLRKMYGFRRVHCMWRSFFCIRLMKYQQLWNSYFKSIKKWLRTNSQISEQEFAAKWIRACHWLRPQLSSGICLWHSRYYMLTFQCVAMMIHLKISTLVNLSFFLSGSFSHGTGKFARRDDATVEPSAAWTDTGQCYSCDHKEQKLEG